MTSYADGFTYVEEVLLRGTPEEGINIKASHLVRATYFNGRPRIDDPVPINVANLDGFLPEWFAGMAGQVAAAEAARDVALADAKAAQDDRDARVAAADADRDAKVTAAEKDRDEKVAAAEADKASAIAAAEADRDARLAEKDARIADLEAQIAPLTAEPERSIHKAYLRAALASIERLAEVDAAVQAAGAVKWELWANATTISQDDPDVNAIADALGIDLDAVFVAARAIRAARGG